MLLNEFLKQYRKVEEQGCEVAGTEKHNRGANMKE